MQFSATTNDFYRANTKDPYPDKAPLPKMVSVPAEVTVDIAEEMTPWELFKQLIKWENYHNNKCNDCTNKELEPRGMPAGEHTGKEKDGIAHDAGGGGTTKNPKDAERAARPDTWA